jgi:hypothetical protein
MNTDNRSGFPVLYGQRITNSAEFIEAQTAAWRDLIAGRISVKKANTINREARKILKMFQAVVACAKLGRRASKNLVR